MDNNYLGELHNRRRVLLAQIKKAERAIVGYVELGLEKRAGDCSKYVGKKLEELGRLTLEISSIQNTGVKSIISKVISKILGG